MTTTNNAAYWIGDPLDDESLLVLMKISRGQQKPYNDVFDIAYLISRDCVEADLDKGTLTVTNKGRDALEFFKKDAHGQR